MKILRPALTAAVAALALTALTACAGPSPAPAADTPSTTASATPSAAAAFPVTVEVPGGEPVTLEREPQRIAALSTDVAAAMHELGLTDRIVAMPEGSLNEALNPHAADMAGVPNLIAGENSPEPEQVLAWEPDLVVVTARHTGEQDAAGRLTATGVPVLSLVNGWSTSDAVIENLELIGQATGTAEAADELAAEIRDGIEDVRARAAEAETTPTVAILSNQARSPFINAGASLVSELVANGGGTNVAETIGIDNTMPIQPEQLVAANPDHIMLVDVTGKGEGSFDAILGNPAVAALPAVAEGRVKVFLGREVYALAGREVVSGSESVLAWLHPELTR